MRQNTTLRMSLLRQEGQFVLECLQTYQTVAQKSSNHGEQVVLKFKATCCEKLEEKNLLKNDIIFNQCLKHRIRNM